MSRLQDKVILITGAAAGIGRASAFALANEGAKVALSDVNAADGQATAATIRNQGGDAMFVEADVSIAEDVEAMIGATVAHFKRLDAAVNNAGVEHANVKLADCTQDMWQRTIDINLKGVWQCMKYEIQQMLDQRYGVIINMASVAGLGGAPTLGLYAASKHGVVGLTKTAAVEYAKAGIRVNAVCPGFTHTAMLERTVSENPDLEQTLLKASPMKRFGDPDEVAATVVWLCSEEASFLNGTAIPVDGGMMAW